MYFGQYYHTGSWGLCISVCKTAGLKTVPQPAYHKAWPETVLCWAGWVTVFKPAIYHYLPSFTTRTISASATATTLAADWSKSTIENMFPHVQSYSWTCTDIPNRPPWAMFQHTSLFCVTWRLHFTSFASALCWQFILYIDTNCMEQSACTYS